MNNAEKKYGVGIEMEGFIVNGERAKERIDGLPASEWVMKEVKRDFPGLAGYLSFEQASVMLEVKSDVFDEEIEAIEQILQIREALNKILGKAKARLIFQPVLEKDFEFVAATSDPNSRTQQLITEWSKTPLGLSMLYATAIASLQINDSRPYKGVCSNEEKLELSRKIHNLYSANFPQLNSGNGEIRDAAGKTRMDKLLFLLPEVKKQKFLAHGYTDPMVAALPGHFETVEQMKRWMMANSGVEKFEDADCKNEHAVTVKIKRSGDNWISESRVYDAVDQKEQIIRIAQNNTDLLKQIN